MRILELFAGIGACSKALERIGIDVEIVDAVEIDKYAMASFNAIHGTDFKVQDIKEWDKDIGDIDLITHGSPCQDFSIAGKQAGGDLGSGTRSSLMYETIRIVGKIRPKFVLWENVKNILSKKHKHNFEAYIETMNILGYNSYYKVLNAKDYGVPQNRERVYTVSIRKDIDTGYEFPEPMKLKLRLKDMLEDEVEEKYYLDDERVKKIINSNFMQEKKRVQEKDVCDTLLARDWKDPKCIRIGQLDNSFEQSGRIYSDKGISPTIMSNSHIGGYVPPKILEDGFVERKYNNFIKEKGYVPEMFNPYNESEIKEIAPTQSSQCGSMTSSATVLIKNATKKGYDEAIDGDSVNLQYPDNKTRRGRVGHQVSQTLMANDSMGVVEGIKVIGNYMPSNHDASRIVDSNGLAPTVKENHGTVTATIIKPKLINNDKRLKRLVEKTEFKEGKALNLDLYNQTTNEDISQCLTEPHHNTQRLFDGYRIRKLTPKECWRLMGFDDEDFEKAKNVPMSNTQLYKQARKLNLRTSIGKNI